MSCQICVTTLRGDTLSTTNVSLLSPICNGDVLLAKNSPTSSAPSPRHTKAHQCCLAAYALILHKRIAVTQFVALMVVEQDMLLPHGAYDGTAKQRQVMCWQVVGKGYNQYSVSLAIHYVLVFYSSFKIYLSL